MPEMGRFVSAVHPPKRPPPPSQPPVMMQSASTGGGGGGGNGVSDSSLILSLQPAPLARFPISSVPTTNGKGQGPINDDSSPNIVEEEDERPWCFCGDRSYGDMVECSNKQCLYIWFHFACVGIIHKPIGNWLCPQCKQRGNGIVEL